MQWERVNKLKTIMNKNIFPVTDKIAERKFREQQLNQKAIVVWMTGLSGAGKSTLAQGLTKELTSRGFLTKMLDGDDVRNGINNNLGFSEADRYENIRRVAEISKLFMDCGIICISSFISPTNDIRDMVRSIIGKYDYFEVFVNAPIEVCESRDVKGLYEKARKGEIKDFTGIDSPFNIPENPSIVINTDSQSAEESINKLVDILLPRISYTS